MSNFFPFCSASYFMTIVAYIKLWKATEVFSIHGTLQLLRVFLKTLLLFFLQYIYVELHLQHTNHPYFCSGKPLLWVQIASANHKTQQKCSVADNTGVNQSLKLSVSGLWVCAALSGKAYCNTTEEQALTWLQAAVKASINTLALALATLALLCSVGDEVSTSRRKIYELKLHRWHSCGEGQFLVRDSEMALVTESLGINHWCAQWALATAMLDRIAFQ